MKEEKVQSTAYQFTIERDGKTIGRASLFLITNNDHAEPYGLFEDLAVEPEYQGQGIGTELVEQVIQKTKEVGCYKLIATSRNSRPQVHAWYKRLGFDKYGAAFRIDF